MKLGLVVKIFIFGAVFSTHLQAADTATLRVEAASFQNDTGQAVVKLYRQSDNFPTEPFMILASNIVDNKSVLTFEDIPYGNYAAVLYQDINSNRILDHNAINFPKEPLGFSNEWKLGLTSGMPNFEKLKFDFLPQNPVLIINIQ